MIRGIYSAGRPESEYPGSHVLVFLAHLAGGLAGGVTVAWLMWLIATPMRTLLPPIAIGAGLVGVAVWALMVDQERFGPNSRAGSQVPQSWLTRYGLYRAFTMYGFELGLGIASFVPFAVTYVAMALLASSHSVLVALVAGASFGGSRALLVGLGSLIPDTASIVLFGSAGVQKALRVISSSASLAVLAVVAGSLF